MPLLRIQWLRLSVWLVLGGILLWWVLRTPPEKINNPEKIAATRASLAAAIQAVLPDGPRAVAKFTAAIRTFLDTVHGGKKFRTATAAEIFKQCSDQKVISFFRATERPLYAPTSRATEQEVELLRELALDILEHYTGI